MSNYQSSDNRVLDNKVLYNGVDAIRYKQTTYLAGKNAARCQCKVQGVSQTFIYIESENLCATMNENSINAWKDINYIEKLKDNGENDEKYFEKIILDCNFVDKLKTLAYNLEQIKQQQSELLPNFSRLCIIPIEEILQDDPNDISIDYYDDDDDFHMSP